MAAVRPPWTISLYSSYWAGFAAGTLAMRYPLGMMVRRKLFSRIRFSW